jgi:protein-S-isoprenylcysteine O-methyltransferase
MMVVLGGQFLRSMAMIHASTNFSHMIAHHHRDGHVLVTRGIYRLALSPVIPTATYSGHQLV